MRACSFQSIGARLIERVFAPAATVHPLVQRGLRGLLARQFVGQPCQVGGALSHPARRAIFSCCRRLTTQYQNCPTVGRHCADHRRRVRPIVLAAPPRARVLHFLHGFAVTRFKIRQIFMSDGELFTQHRLIFQRLFALGGEVVHVVEQLPFAVPAIAPTAV